MLGDAHGIEQGAGAIFRHHAGGQFDISRRHAGDVAGHFGRVFFQHRLQFLETFGAIPNEVVVLPVFSQDHMHEAVEQGDVGAWLVAKMQIGVVGYIDAPGVGHDQFDPTLAFGPSNLRADDGMVFSRIGANDEDALAIVGDVPDGVGHRTAAEGCHQTGDGSGVSQPGAVVDTMRRQHLPCEFAEDEILFVGALGRGQQGEGVAAVSLSSPA